MWKWLTDQKLPEWVKNDPKVHSARHAIEHKERREKREKQAHNFTPLDSSWKRIGHVQFGQGVDLGHVPKWVQKAFENVGITLEEGYITARIKGHHFEYLIVRHVYGQGGGYSESTYYHRPLRS